MAKFDRRRFLFTGLTAGLSGSAIAQTAHAQSASTNPTDPTERNNAVLDAIIGERELTTGDRPSRSSPDLSSTPIIPYDRAMSRLLIQCSQLGMEQFERGQTDPRFNGSIQELASYTSALDAYTQIATFGVSLDATTTLFPSLGRVGRGVSRRIVAPTLVTFGFVLAAPTNNIILFRGTANPKEWLANFQANQSAFVQSRQVRGQVHTGFLRLYDDLTGQVRRAVNRLNPRLPCFVAGHSLGGALATLATADLASNYPNFKDQLRLYTYGAPRVGDRAFAEFVRTTAPNSYRVFNLSDMVSMVPPADALEQQYSHAGQPWGFVDYAEGSVGLSHSTTTYRLAIEGQIEVSPLPRFPAACRETGGA